LARVAAVARLLALLAKREVRGIRSVGTNNLFLLGLFLISGSTARRAFLNTLPFQWMLIMPLLVAMSVEAQDRIPEVRRLLWPLGAAEKAAVRLMSLALNPGFWLLGTVMSLWGGLAAGMFYAGMAVVVQSGTLWLRVGSRAGWSVQPLRWIPRFPGALGGIVQVELRGILRTLDVYAALLVCLAGTCYRGLARAPQTDAFPVVAIVVALALSTYAQRSFGLDRAGTVVRYRLLPLRGWRLLLAKDAAYLVVVLLLVLPLGVVPGMTVALVAVTIGRHPALRQSAPQRAWRFTGGDLRFGLAQIMVGALAGIASIRLGAWVIAVAGVAYGASVWMGGRWLDSGHRPPG
jgi:hypothetical protein